MSLADFQPPASDAPIDWALAYASAGMAIFPVGANKKPLTAHGLKDASTNDTAIRSWWRKWRHADIGWAVPADVVVVDLGQKGSSDGLRDFQTEQGVSADDVETPQASTPSGGRHLIFSANGTAYRNGVRINGHAVDLRTEGGHIVLPGPKDGRRWLKPLTTPLKPVPAWIAPKPHRTPPRVAPHAFAATPYGRKALDRACEEIRCAPNGAQEPTLNRECFSIGGLIAGGQLDHDPAVARLIEAAHAMPAHAEPWGDLSEKVRRSVADGMRHPRRPPEGREGPTVKEFRGRPTIILRVGETERIVDEIESALIAADRGLYQRGGFIVAAGFDRMPTWDGRTVELQVIEEQGDYALLEDIQAVAKFVKPARTAKVGGEKFKLCAPPIALVRTLKQRRHRLRLPTLVGVVNCPFIKANGELVTKPGFDPKSGILFAAGDAAFPSIPDRPTKGDAERALARLRRLIATFDFVTPDDQAVALSLILTAISRPAMPFVPLHGFTAPVAGAGKSMLVDIASILATGHEAGVSALNGNLEEAHKHLSALLMRGDQIIALDNCEHPLEGVLLNQTLTQTRLELRILGELKLVTARCASVVAATGNNLVVKGDMTRRALVGKLDPKVARPELREFDYDPIDDAKTNRCELVTAALTVLRAYHVAGRPNRVPPLDSFKEWSKTVREPLLWLGAGDPVKTMERTRKTDPVLKSLRAVMRAWFEAFTVSPTTARMATAEADSRPALHDALIAVVGRAGKIDGRMFGNWLAKHSDCVVDIADEGGEPAFFAFEQAGDRSGVALWRLAERQK